MAEYPFVKHKRPRSRDFYDICSILESKPEIDLTSPSNIEVLREIFAAKKVPLDLLGQIAAYREFHSGDWASVTAATSGDLRDFDYYFDEVLSQVSKLEALWKK